MSDATTESVARATQVGESRAHAALRLGKVVAGAEACVALARMRRRTAGTAVNAISSHFSSHIYLSVFRSAPAPPCRAVVELGPNPAISSATVGRPAAPSGQNAMCTRRVHVVRPIELGSGSLEPRTPCSLMFQLDTDEPTGPQRHDANALYTRQHLDWLLAPPSCLVSSPGPRLRQHTASPCWYDPTQRLPCEWRALTPPTQPRRSCPVQAEVQAALDAAPAGLEAAAEAVRQMGYAGAPRTLYPDTAFCPSPPLLHSSGTIQPSCPTALPSFPGLACLRAVQVNESAGGSLRALRHTFLSVWVPGGSGIGGQEVIVDLSFADQVCRMKARAHGCPGGVAA